MCENSSVLVQCFFLSPHQFILELCRREQPVEHDFILSHLDKIKSQHPSLVDVSVYTLNELSLQTPTALLSSYFCLC